jgi:hypothetical protein
VASEPLEPKPVLEKFTEIPSAKEKWQENVNLLPLFMSASTYIFRIAIWMGVTCHFFEIYIWSGFSNLRQIWELEGLDT